MELKKYRLFSNKESIWGFFFSIPWIIGFIMFFAYPLMYSIALAFSRIEDIVTFKIRYTGFSNFTSAFNRDIEFVPLLIESVSNMIIKTPVVVIFSLFIAVLLNRNIKFKGIYRAAFFLPVLLGTGAVMQIIQENSSFLNFGSDFTDISSSSSEMLSFKGITISDRLTILLGPTVASYLQQILTQISEVLWMSGIQIVIFLGALQTIPNSLYEAAYCDSATEWEKFWKITLPLMMPTILLNTIYTMIDYFTNRDNAVIHYTISVAFHNFRLGYGSALGWIYFSIIGIIVAIVFLAMKKYTFYMGEK